MTIFNFPENIPLIIFSLALLTVFSIFLWGFFLLVTAGHDDQKTEKAKKIFKNVLYSLFLILLSALVFVSITYLLNKREKLYLLSKKFPPTPASNYPPSPRFFKIDRYYFSGPWRLKDKNIISRSLLYAVLCKKGDKYDIIYINNVKNTKKQVDLLKDKQYICWSEKCGREIKNLYIAFFENPSESSNNANEEIKKNLERQTKPLCPPKETNSN